MRVRIGQHAVLKSLRREGEAAPIPETLVTTAIRLVQIGVRCVVQITLLLDILQSLRCAPEETAVYPSTWEFIRLISPIYNLSLRCLPCSTVSQLDLSTTYSRAFAIYPAIDVREERIVACDTRIRVHGK